MNKTIYCRTVGKGEQAFYVQIGKEDYYLFTQKYYRGVKDYFQNGVNINDLSVAEKHHNTAVRKTAEKIPTYLTYIEKEYDKAVFNKTLKGRKRKGKKQCKCKMEKFNWRTLDLEAI